MDAEQRLKAIEERLARLERGKSDGYATDVSRQLAAIGNLSGMGPDDDD